MRGVHLKRRKRDWSQLLALLVILFGFAIAQECIVLMYLCIRSSFSSTAAWLTAAIGLAEAVIGLGLSTYLGLCKSDHSVGGITYEKAKAKNFTETEI